jgi:hypothetical protein
MPKTKPKHMAASAIEDKKSAVKKQRRTAVLKRLAKDFNEQADWKNRYHAVLERAGMTGHRHLKTLGDIVALVMPGTPLAATTYQELDSRVSAYAAEWASRYPTAASPREPKKEDYSVQQMLGFTGVSNRTLNRYCVRARVNTPGIGQRNFRFPHADAVTVLKAFIDSSSEGSTLERCKESLQQISN